MNYAPSALWRTPPTDFEARLSALLAAGLGRGPLRVYCRADDVGMGGTAFCEMITCFARHKVPLALAVVPSWLPLGLSRLGRDMDFADPLWSLHQHGYRHASTARSGKKMEFGPDMPGDAKRRLLAAGRDMLRRAFGGRFVPLFTPPWNRCDQTTMEILRELGFAGTSRWQGALPAVPLGLRELPVNVDLHIRKEADPEAQLCGLLAELRGALSLGYLGLMLHHQRQTGASLEFLDLLLGRLAASGNVRFVDARTALAAGR